MDLEALQDVALRVSGERSADGVLRHIVDGLIQRPGVALARVWITGPVRDEQERVVRPNDTRPHVAGGFKRWPAATPKNR